MVFGRPYYRSRLWYTVSSVCLSVTFCIVAKWYFLAKNCLKEWIGNQGKKLIFGSPPYFYFRFRLYGHPDGRFCLIFAQFEVSTFAHYEDMKGIAKCRNLGGFGVRVTQGHQLCHYSIQRIQLPIGLPIRLSCTVFESYWVVKSPLGLFLLTPPALRQLGLTPFEFRRDLWHKKTI